MGSIEYETFKNGVLVNINHFSLEETFECGQCFRAEKIDAGKYVFIAFGRVMTIQKLKNGFLLTPCTTEEFENIWIRYFDFNRDYESIIQTLAAKDNVVKDAALSAKGIRILRQEFFECLISFIISQNSSIPKIKKSIKALSEMFGDMAGTAEGFHSFPTLERLNNASIEQIRACKTGFRDRYIKDACQKLADAEIEESKLNTLPTDELRRELMKIKGVGTKVADCVMLFSFGRFDIFPTDVWIKRIMQHFYFEGREVLISDIHELAKSKYGEYSGFAQQYLFYYARRFNVGKREIVPLFGTTKEKKQ
jgi:N-glycosylase/DNA lyase